MNWLSFATLLLSLSVGLGFACLVVWQNRNEAKLAAAEQQEVENERQQQLRQLISGFESNSTMIIGGLPGEITNAESAIDEAEREFTEGAFAPFWDAIERAVNSLARFDLGVQQLLGQFNNCKNEIRRLEAAPQTVQFDVKAIPDAADASTRLQKMVHRAQKDFQFATIYEQRKTNQLLVAGFSSLGQALSIMNDRITSSIDALSDSMADSINELMVSNTADAAAVVAGVGALNQQMQSDARKERGMIDDIRRDRKPLI